MHDVVFSKMLSMISKANFLVVSAYEVTIVDVQWWISIHGYVMHNWKHVHVLLILEKVEVVQLQTTSRV
jgi:hypothetical protein